MKPSSYVSLFTNEYKKGQVKVYVDESTTFIEKSENNAARVKTAVALR